MKEDLGYGRSTAHLSMELDGLDKVPQQVMRVAKVTVGPPLGGAVTQLFDQAQVHPGEEERHIT